MPTKHVNSSACHKTTDLSDISDIRVHVGVQHGKLLCGMLFHVTAIIEVNFFHHKDTNIFIYRFAAGCAHKFSLFTYFH